MIRDFKLLFALCAFVLGLSICVNVFLIKKNIEYQAHEQTSHEHLADVYTRISPRVFASHRNDVLINFVQLRTDLRKYVAKIDAQVGVYLEYLPSGVSIGLNENQNFLLASLLKVPATMAVYEQIHRGKISKDQRISLQEKDLDSGFGDLYKKGAGYSISVEDLVRLAVTESDNTAYKTIVSLVGPESVARVFDSLDIPEDRVDMKGVVTAENYSSVLRSLYLSSYLPLEFSNELLEIMTTSPFDDMIVSGVPKDVKVAHKIGIHQQVDDVDSIYNDCGIIYIPKRPYILCIMMQADEATVKKTMKDISKMTYTYIVNQNIEPKSFQD